MIKIYLAKSCKWLLNDNNLVKCCELTDNNLSNYEWLLNGKILEKNYVWCNTVYLEFFFFFFCKKSAFKRSHQSSSIKDRICLCTLYYMPFKKRQGHCVITCLLTGMSSYGLMAAYLVRAEILFPIISCNISFLLCLSALSRNLETSLT